MRKFIHSLIGLVGVVAAMLTATGAAVAQVEQPAQCAASLARDVYLSGYLPVEGPKPVTQVSFVDAQGKSRTISEWKGKALVLNFWATWCPPCVKELPSLARLRSHLKVQDIDVLAINVDQVDPAKVTKFLAGVEASALEPFRDPGRTFMKAAKIASLPTTLLVNAEGQEVAAVLQDAQWDDPDIVAFIRTCLGNKKAPKQ